MAKQLADDWQAKATAGTKTGICVPEIMKPDAVKPSAFRDGLPWTLEISAGPFGIIAWDHVGADPIEGSQHGQRWSVQDHGLLAGFGVCQEKQASLQVDLLPLEVKDFPEPAAGEQQEPDSGGRKGADLGEAVLWLGQMLRLRLCLVYVPRNSLCLCFANGRTERFQLYACQEPLAS